MAVLQYVAVHGCEGIGFLLGEEVVIAFADEILSGITQQLLTSLVYAHKLQGLGILDKNHVRDIFDDGSHQRLIVPCLFRGSFAFRDVSSNALVSFEPAGLVEHRHPSTCKKDRSAILMQVQGLDAAK